MKKSVIVFLILLFALKASAQNTKKTLFVIADGIPADLIERMDLPNLRKIISKGSYTRMHVGGDISLYNQTPTISAVGYNSLLTSTWVNKHNVPDNEIKAPNYNYQNIFRLFKTQYPSKKTAVFSSWEDNRTKLLGYHLPDAGNLDIDYFYDGYEKDTVNFKHDKAKNYMHLIDEKVVSEASSTIKNIGPDLSWVYLEYTDDMGHAHGDSPEFYAAIKMLDVQMGKLYDSIQYRETHFNEKWLLIITTDHGRDEKTGRGHGGQSPRQRNTWMVTNFRPLNAYATRYQPAIVDILPTITRFMNIEASTDIKREFDGTPLIGKVSVAEPNAIYVQGNLDITWKAIDPAGNVKIWLAKTNSFRIGKQDNYELIGEVPVGDQHAFIDIKKYTSDFYKVVLEAPENMVNKWILLEGNK